MELPIKGILFFHDILEESKEYKKVKSSSLLLLLKI